MNFTFDLSTFDSFNPKQKYNISRCTVGQRTTTHNATLTLAVLHQIPVAMCTHCDVSAFIIYHIEDKLTSQRTKNKLPCHFALHISCPYFMDINRCLSTARGSADRISVVNRNFEEFLDNFNILENISCALTILNIDIKLYIVDVIILIHLLFSIKLNMNITIHMSFIQIEYLCNEFNFNLVYNIEITSH